MNVLLVDDEPTIRKMMRSILQRRGFQVFDASKGVDALTVAQNNPIDVLVTDVVMGDMDGPTLAHSLVERKPDLPVLFVSGYPMDLEAERQRFTRCAFLRKPFQPSELFNAISEVSGAESHGQSRSI
jgi:two-component system cell cycle sensor histidine kinase/response regulator CckA